VDLGNTALQFLAGSSQVFNFNIGVTGVNGVVANQLVPITVNGGATGLSGAQVISSLNGSLAQYGINASIAGDGTLQFGGTTAFSVATVAAGGGTPAATALSQTVNSSNYNLSSLAGTAAAAFAGFATTSTETVVLQNGSGTTSVTLNSTAAGTFSGSNGVYTGSADNITDALATLNSALKGTGISAVADALGTSISFQSDNVFSVSETALTAGGGGNLFGGVGQLTVTPAATTSTGTGNSIQALAQLATAGTNLGLVQGTVGAGINLLSYAVSLAQSQITNFSAAESGIKDANIAAEAANLTKAQVLQQASLAALAQANSSPQAVLKLLQG
jgi:flagellin